MQRNATHPNGGQQQSSWTWCQARTNHVCDAPRPEKLRRAFDLNQFQLTQTKKNATAKLRFSDCPKADTSIRHRERWISIQVTQYQRMRTADGPFRAASRPRIVDWDNPLDHAKKRFRRIETKKLQTRCHCERLCWRKRPPHSGVWFRASEVEVRVAKTAKVLGTRSFKAAARCPTIWDSSRGTSTSPDMPKPMIKFVKGFAATE